jgi:hypothetical protein
MILSCTCRVSESSTEHREMFAAGFALLLPKSVANTHYVSATRKERSNTILC